MKIRNLFLIGIAFFLASMTASGQKLSPVSVKGNQFVTKNGEEIVFHGVNIRDPYDLERDGKWTFSHFQEAKNWGADLIRLPVHPHAWRESGTEQYIELIDTAVEWAKKLGIYLIIDWHSIGNLHTESYQNKMYNTTLEETHEFWNIISEKYKNEPVIAMYELFNEPTVGGNFGALTWPVWKTMNEEMIDLIRKNDANKVILVAGFNWAYDLTPIEMNPIERKGIAYVSHPYPEKRKQPWEAQWEKDWGFVAKKYPVILTEIGFATPDERGVHIPVHGDETYGNALVNFTAERGISWVVWCFDERWSPLMYTDSEYTPTRQGAFFKKVMLGD